MAPPWTSALSPAPPAGIPRRLLHASPAALPPDQGPRAPRASYPRSTASATRLSPAVASLASSASSCSTGLSRVHSGRLVASTPAERCTAQPRHPAEFGFGYITAMGYSRTSLHISCFRQEQDVSTTSDDGTGFKYNEQAEISGDPDLKEEDGVSPNKDDQNYVNGDWFVRAQKIKENLQETIFRFWNGRWAVPWTGQTIAQSKEANEG